VKDSYEEWFGEEYLALYPHRDDEEAREVAALIAGRIDVLAGSPALDLGCGSGRHQRAMVERGGFDVVEILGAYDGRPRDDDSPRAILIGARR
jgi:cyclopropane fatty-acyl-phospholipid synthase-like methyltransferase